MYIESNLFRPYVCKYEYTRYNSIIEFVKLATPEDGPLGSKHVALHMLTNNCCVDSGICIVDCITQQDANFKNNLCVQWLGEVSAVYCVGHNSEQYTGVCESNGEYDGSVETIAIAEIYSGSQY
jgi:hypothetical protein